MISAKFVSLKYYTLSSQLQRLTSFSVGCSGRRILSPGQIAVMQKWSIEGKKYILAAILFFNMYITFFGSSSFVDLESMKFINILEECKSVGSFHYRGKNLDFLLRFLVFWPTSWILSSKFRWSIGLF